MLKHVRPRGFSLVELVVTLAVVAILVLAGLPGITDWIQNSQIRTAAEGLQNGLQIARTEAIRRNTRVEFELSSPGTKGGTGWTIKTTNPAATIQSSPDGVGSKNVTLTPAPAVATSIVFDGFGRPVPDNESLTQIDLDNTALSTDASRNLRILITSGGEIRMCDPNVDNTLDPRICPQ